MNLATSLNEELETLTPKSNADVDNVSARTISCGLLLKQQTESEPPSPKRDAQKNDARALPACPSRSSFRQARIAERFTVIFVNRTQASIALKMLASEINHMESTSMLTPHHREIILLK
ncbi:hypothetical protein BASA60_004337 [Batrachochytrium salamandrivorans]|nr:hypothetical protein BASA60_004337 [Batrachochytrium salamandrivorans]